MAAWGERSDADDLASTSRRGSCYHAGLTRQGVIEGAREVIAARGLTGLTMRSLSEHLGVALGATYRHIATRAELLVLVGYELFDRVARASTNDGDWLDQMRERVVNYVEIFSQHPGMALFVMTRVQDFADSDVNQVMARAIAASGLSARDAEAVNTAVFFYVAPFNIGGWSGSVDPLSDERFVVGLEVLFKGIAAMAIEPGA